METPLFKVGDYVVPSQQLSDEEIQSLVARVHTVREVNLPFIKTDLSDWVDANKFVLYATPQLEHLKRLNRILEDALVRKAGGRTADALWTQTVKDMHAASGIPVSDKPREVMGLGVSRIQTNAVSVVQTIHAVYQNLIEAHRSMEKLDDSVRKLEEDLRPLLPEIAVSILYPVKSPELVDALRPDTTTT